MFICEALWACLLYEKWYINKVALSCLALTHFSKSLMLTDECHINVDVVEGSVQWMEFIVQFKMYYHNKLTDFDQLSVHFLLCPWWDSSHLFSDSKSLGSGSNQWRCVVSHLALYQILFINMQNRSSIVIIWIVRFRANVYFVNHMESRYILSIERAWSSKHTNAYLPWSPDLSASYKHQWSSVLHSFPS